MENYKSKITVSADTMGDVNKTIEPLILSMISKQIDGLDIIDTVPTTMVNQIDEIEILLTGHKHILTNVLVGGICTNNAKFKSNYTGDDYTQTINNIGHINECDIFVDCELYYSNTIVCVSDSDELFNYKIGTLEQISEHTYSVEVSYNIAKDIKKYKIAGCNF